MRIHAITNTQTNETRLVEAPSRNAAVRHVADQVFKAKIASQKELVDLTKAGIPVEQVGEQSAEPSGGYYDDAGGAG